MPTGGGTSDGRDPGADGEGPLTGRLLVASPRLVDGIFDRSVVLVLDHGDHGAIGVVLNRPGGVAVRELLPRWHPLATPPAELFTGGPVARNALIGLARLAPGDATAASDPTPHPPGWRVLIDDARPVGTVDLQEGPGAPEVRAAMIGARLFSGYAGWETGQLEDEIDKGAWLVVRAEAHDPLSADPEGLWRRVLRRQGGSLALLAGYPPDPAAN